MDLTKTYPRSVREKHLGLVQVARTIDKGKASLAGTLGEYKFDCPMDQHLFEFLGVTNQQVLDAIKKGDAAVDEFFTSAIAKKSPTDLDTFNREWLEYGPAPGSESEQYFLDLRNKIAPDRADVRSWPDLLDLDEKRPVPQRAHA